MDMTEVLPDHILTDIFGYLSPKLMKSCTLVCKRWAEIIGDSRKFKQCYQLRVDKSFDLKGDQVKRKYRSIETDKFTAEIKRIMSGQNLHTLKININIFKLIQLLSSLAMIKVLIIPEVRNHRRQTVLETVKAQLTQLCCDISILHIFECDTLETLRLTNMEYLIDRFAILVDYLKKQRNLKKLDLDGAFFSEMFGNPELLEVPFSLTEFKFYQGEEGLHLEQFIKFLGLHKATLTSFEVELNQGENGINHIHQYALENLLNLKHITSGYTRIGEENIIQVSPKKLEKIESLNFKEFSTDVNENKIFLEMFPNLKHLKLPTSMNDGHYEFLKQMNVSIINLESLHTGLMWDVEDVDIYFPKLKKLFIHYVHVEAALCSFIDRHSKTLEVISLCAVNNITELTIKELIKCDTLKLIELSIDDKKIVCFMKALEEIISKFKRIRIDISLRRTNVFNFPDDQALWNERIADLELYHEENKRIKELEHRAYCYC